MGHWDIGHSTGLYCAEYSQTKDVGIKILGRLGRLMSILGRLKIETLSTLGTLARFMSTLATFMSTLATFRYWL